MAYKRRYGYRKAVRVCVCLCVKEIISCRPCYIVPHYLEGRRPYYRSAAGEDDPTCEGRGEMGWRACRGEGGQACGCDGGGSEPNGQSAGRLGRRMPVQSPVESVTN